MGPSGLVSIDDSEVMRALRSSVPNVDPDAEAFVEMGGTDTETPTTS